MEICWKASGNLLESFENYNDLYCLTELLSNKCKVSSMNFLSLGGAVIANYAVGVGGSTDLVNPSQYKYGAYRLFDQDYAAQSSTGGYTMGQKRGRY